MPTLCIGMSWIPAVAIKYLPQHVGARWCGMWEYHKLDFRSAVPLVISLHLNQRKWHCYKRHGGPIELLQNAWQPPDQRCSLIQSRFWKNLVYLILASWWEKLLSFTKEQPPSQPKMLLFLLNSLIQCDHASRKCHGLTSLVWYR